MNFLEILYCIGRCLNSYNSHTQSKARFFNNYVCTRQAQTVGSSRGIVFSPGTRVVSLIFRYGRMQLRGPMTLS